MRSFVLLTLFLLAPSVLAQGEWKPRRDPAAVTRVVAAEKLAYFPRCEGLSKLKFTATLTKPGKHAVFDQPLGAFTIWLEEPEDLRVESRRAPGREDVRDAEETLAHHDGKRCVLADLVDRALWPYALYPNSDLKSIEFAPKSKTRIRIFDRHRTGVEVTFGRNGLPKQHTRYEKGKRQRFEKLVFGDYAGKWLLDLRTAQGGKDETRYHWEKKDGIYLPKSIDRTLGKAEFRIDLEYEHLVKRPEGTPPVLPPRSDPADVAVLARAGRLRHDPVSAGLASARFQVTVSDRRQERDRTFTLSFTAPGTTKIVGEGTDEATDDPTKDLVESCFLKLPFVAPPTFPDLENWLVTKDPEKESTYLLSDRRSTRIDVRLYANGAVAAWTKRRVDPVMTEHAITWLLVDGKSQLERSRSPAEKSTLEWWWRKVDGFWMPHRVLHRHDTHLTAMTASEWTVTKVE